MHTDTIGCIKKKRKEKKEVGGASGFQMKAYAEVPKNKNQKCILSFGQQGLPELVATKNDWLSTGYGVYGGLNNREKNPIVSKVHFVSY